MATCPVAAAATAVWFDAEQGVGTFATGARQRSSESPGDNRLRLPPLVATPQFESSALRPPCSASEKYGMPHLTGNAACAQPDP